MSRKIEESNRLYFSFKTLSNLLGIKESSAKVVVNRLVKRGGIAEAKKGFVCFRQKMGRVRARRFFFSG